MFSVDILQKVISWASLFKNKPIDLKTFRSRFPYKNLSIKCEFVLQLMNRLQMSSALYEQHFTGHQTEIDYVEVFVI